MDRWDTSDTVLGEDSRCSKRSECYIGAKDRQYCGNGKEGATWLSYRISPTVTLLNLLASWG
jgi:hypothetical protein